MKVKALPLIASGLVIAGLIALMLIALNGGAQKGNRPVVGAPAPDFALDLYAGYTGGLPSSTSLAALRGKVVVMNFWASWCGPCHDEADALQRVHERFKDRGVVFLGIDVLDTERDAGAYLTRYGVTYANGLDVAQRISGQIYRVTGQPETFIIDTDGRVHSVIIGPTSEQSLTQKIEDALK
jgi:cytochrome c biogenesis protein CcmG, thiol:disulfide interchange protein DsbE